MTNRYAVIFIAIIVTFIISQPCLAQEQTFSISRPLDQKNNSPRMAVNTTTGDVLVVWTRFVEEKHTDTNIYAALCKLQSDGSFKIGKARIISNYQGFCDMPTVSYCPENNSFLVAWRVGRLLPMGYLRIDIQARVVNEKGKSVGRIIEALQTDDHFEDQPVLAAVPQSVREAVPGATFLMCWQARPLSSSKYESDAGLWSVLLDRKGRKVSAAKRIWKMDYELDGESSRIGWTIPCRIISTEKVPFYLAMVNERVLQSWPFRETYAIKLDVNGGYLGKILLDRGGYLSDTRIAPLSNDLLLTSWYSSRNNKCYNQAVESTLKKRRKSYSLQFGVHVIPELVALADGGIIQIISLQDGFSVFRIDSKGNKKNRQYLTFVETGPLWPLDFVAAEIPGTEKVLLVWSRNVDNGGREIIGTALDIDK